MQKCTMSLGGLLTDSAHQTSSVEHLWTAYSRLDSHVGLNYNQAFSSAHTLYFSLTPYILTHSLPFFFFFLWQGQDDLHITGHSQSHKLAAEHWSSRETRSTAGSTAKSFSLTDTEITAHSMTERVGVPDMRLWTWQVEPLVQQQRYSMYYADQGNTVLVLCRTDCKPSVSQTQPMFNCLLTFVRTHMPTTTRNISYFAHKICSTTATITLSLLLWILP